MASWQQESVSIACQMFLSVFSLMMLGSEQAKVSKGPRRDDDDRFYSSIEKPDRGCPVGAAL